MCVLIYRKRKQTKSENKYLLKGLVRIEGNQGVAQCKATTFSKKFIYF